MAKKGLDAYFEVINVETGIIYAACDKLGGTFERHPDSGINLFGFKIPRWEEVIKFVTKAAQILPKVRYVGWDVAVTNAGCVLIEGNDKGRWSFQIPKQEGFRKRNDGRSLCKYYKDVIVSGDYAQMSQELYNRVKDNFTQSIVDSREKTEKRN